MFNQKYSNKKSILFKVLIVLFPFFNVVVTPVEKMTFRMSTCVVYL